MLDKETFIKRETEVEERKDFSEIWGKLKRIPLRSMYRVILKSVGGDE